MRYREHSANPAAIEFCAQLFNSIGPETVITNNPAQMQRNIQTLKDTLNKDPGRSKGLCESALDGALDGHLAADDVKTGQKVSSSVSTAQHPGQRLEMFREIEGIDPKDKGWKQALNHVCKDECEDLLKTMMDQADLMFYITNHVLTQPFSETCAELVVQKVEAHILGCCADACGWNEKACVYWPFMESNEQESWFAECCSEKQIQKFSDRDRMCRSVLPPSKLRDRMLEGNEGLDLGQDETLVWTELGEKSDEGFAAGAAKGEPVQPYFLDWWGITPEEGLQRKLWEVQKHEVSLLQSTTATECKKHQQQVQNCDKKQAQARVNACIKSSGWKAIEPETFDELTKNCKDFVQHDDIRTMKGCQEKAETGTMVSWTLLGDAREKKVSASECHIFKHCKYKFEKLGITAVSSVFEYHYVYEG